MKELKVQLANGIITQLYLFIYEDKYLMDSYISLIEKKIVTEDFKSLNYMQFDYTSDERELYQSLVSMPFMSDRRLVVVRLNDVKSRKSSKDEDDEGEGEGASNSNPRLSKIISVLTEYINSPSESTVLIVACKSIDKRSALYKSFKDKGRIAEFKKPKRGDFFEFVNNQFQRRGLKAERDAVNYIINSVDYNARESEIDMGYFVNEIEKVSMYDTKAKTITLDIVKKVISPSVTEDIFKLTDALTCGDGIMMNKQIYKLKYNSVPVQKTLATIVTTMRNIAICQDLSQRGMNENDIAREKGINPYAVKTAIACRSTFNVNDALKAIKVLAKTDFMIKTGQMDEWLALLNVCTMICSKTYVI